jgi:hypothetical protein
MNLNCKKINFFKLLRIFYLIIFFILFNFTIVKYQANLVIYIIFSLVTLFCLFVSTSRNTKIIYFYIFFFLFFGFWFKYSLNYIFDFKYINVTGKFDFSNFEQLNYVVIISTFVFISFYLPLFSIKNVLTYRFQNQEKNLGFFFLRNKSIIIPILLLLLILMPFINLYFDFYVRGLMPDPDKKIFYYIFNTWINYLSPTIIAYLVYFSYTNKNFWISAVLLIEPLISSISILSRSVILVYYSYFLGVIKLVKIKINTKYLLYLTALFFIFTIISNLFIYELRELRFNNAYQTLSSNKTISQNNKHEIKKNVYFTDIIFNRFLGVDGVMAVSSADNQGFNKLIDSFSSQDIHTQSNYYEHNYLFINSNTNESFLKNNLISSTTPGIVAYLLYSGSEIFVFISIFFISFFLIKFQDLLDDFFHNKIFISVIMFNISSKIFHFGFAVKNSHLTFFAAFFAIIFVIFINKLAGLFNAQSK